MRMIDVSKRTQKLKVLTNPTCCNNWHSIVFVSLIRVELDVSNGFLLSIPSLVLLFRCGNAFRNCSGIFKIYSRGCLHSLSIVRTSQTNI